VRPLVCIRHEEPDHLGTAAEIFEARAIPHRYVDLWRGATLPDPSEPAGIVLLGGEMNVDETEAYPFLAQEKAWVREAVDADVPILGICLGGQLLARSFGAAVDRAPLPETGFFPLEPTEETSADPLFSSFRSGDRLFQWHEDAFELPVGARLLLTDGRGSNQAFRAGDQAWGTQFHPEVTPDLLEDWLKTTPDDVLAGRWGRTRAELLEEAERYFPAHRQRAKELFDRFASLVAGRFGARESRG
jgi:GMP synthase (glutamine-hydrolysing)